ncbi:MAG: PKD domain-containing protein [Flavobacteriales bacterium]
MKNASIFQLLSISSFLLSISPAIAHSDVIDPKPPMVVNKGQWDNRALYRMTIGGGEAWLENGGITFHFRNQEDLEKLHLLHHNKIQASDYSGIRNHVYRQNFIGANTNAQAIGTEWANFHHNYFLGDDQSKWRGQVPVAYTVQYSSFYSGIDLRIGSKDGYFKYDFIVSPGADPAQIKWNYSLIEPKLVNGKLIFSTHAGEVVEYIPEAYQMIDGQKKLISCNYQLKNGIVSFQLGRNYNPNLELIIDPTLIFSTFTGSTTDNWGFTATYDNSGNLYAGSVAFGTGYPTTAGAYDNSFNGGTTDIGITKFSATGNTRLYSTFVGGSNSEAPHSLMVNAAGELHIFGTTSSSNFPVTAGSYDNSFNGGTNITINGISYSAGVDMIVVKMNAAGNALLASTFVGGTANDGVNTAATLNFNYADQMRGEIILDAAGNVYVTSSTLSNNFPTTAGSLSQTLSGTQDGCAYKLDAGLTTLVWSTYIGGSSTDAGYALKVASNGSVYVGGGTRSTNLAVSAGTLHATAPGGTADGYIFNLDGNTGASIRGTYIGTNNYDQVYLLELDNDDDVYVTGQTKGTYPITPGVFSSGTSKQFIHKLTPNLNTTVYSTVIGNTTGTTINISPTAFLVDDCENVYLSGWGGNTNNEGSTTGLPVTSDAYDATTDGSDFYFFVLERNGGSQLYGTFFGGTSAEHVDGGTSRFDPNGTIYQAVCAACGGGNTFPTTPGVVAPNNGSTNCNLGAIKMEFSYTGIVADANAAPNVVACGAPYNVNFQGSSSGVHHIWNFGDGSPNALIQNPIHTFNAVGQYDVMYIAIDSSTCNIADTVFLSVELLPSAIFAAEFDIPPFDPCQPGGLTVDLQFTGSGADSLSWNMGDGTIIADNLAVSHTYSTPGTFIITLTAWDFLCNRSETFTDTVVYNANTVFANANVSPNIIACDPPYNVSFVSTSTAPQHFWDFDDAANSTSTQQNPNFTFVDVGNYNVMYIAIDPTSCNLADTAYLSVTILEPKVFSATLSSTPVPPCTDSVFMNIQFTGTGADSLIWDMGEGTTFVGDTLIDFSYTTPGNYTITMTAFDLLCNRSEVITLNVDVQGSAAQGVPVIPNVFSPNSDGKNDQFVLFYSNLPGVDALASLDVYHMEVYNRWGVKVFESDDSIKRWDGKIKGDPASEGVYFYICTYQRTCWDTEPTTVNGHVTVTK